MKNKIFKIFFTFFLIITLLPIVYAHFPPTHVYYTLESMRTTDSPISRLCKDREEQVIYGNLGADVPVIHYLEGKLSSYKGTHSRSVYNKCLEVAGSDIDLKCVCYGAALHLVQDVNSHYEFVPKYIKRYFSSNIVMHPIIELAGQEQTLDRLENGYSKVVTRKEVEEKAKNSLDLFNKNEKYYNIFADSTGLDMRSDFNIVDSALKGQRWSEQVYGKKVNLPPFYWFVSLITIFIGVGWLVLTRVVGRNNLRFLSYFIGVIIVAIGIVLLSSLLLGKSWIWFNYIGIIPSKFLNVEDTSIIDSKVIDNVKLFLLTEQLNYEDSAIDDASGLDHLDRYGNMQLGPLETAENRFKFGFFPIMMIILVLLTLLLFYKMSKKK